MIKCFLTVLLIFAPLHLWSAESGQNSQIAQPASKQSKTESRLIGDDVDLNALPDLLEIESFELKLDEIWQIETVSRDEETALIVNPFRVRKRGRYYGSLYEYHRNDNFDARNAFDTEKKPEYKRNQFGLSLGAFITSKLKVFGSYDGLRIIRGSTRTSLVPTAAMKQGDFSGILPGDYSTYDIYDPLTGEAFIDNQIPQSRIHPVARNLLSLFPEPNVNGGTYNYVNSDPVIDNNNNISTRVDYELNPQTKIFGTYSIMDGNRRGAVDLPNFGTTSEDRGQRVSIDLTHSFSANKVLNIGLNFNREVNLTLSDYSFQDGLLESVGIEGVAVLDSMDEGYPVMNIGEYAGIGSTSGFGGFGGFGGFPGGGFGGEAPESMHENRYGFDAGYTYIWGDHNIVFGGELDIIQMNDMRTWGARRGQFEFSGQFTGHEFADFLLGIPYSATRGVGSDRIDLRRKSWEFFIRDSWKFSPKFTLSMGLRYSYYPFFNSTHDDVSFLYPVVFDTPLDSEVIVTGSGRARELGLNLDPGHVAYNDKNDWQPNIGIAYSPFGNNRLVIRASYSIRHDDMNPMQAMSYVGRNFPFFYSESAESPGLVGLDIGQPFESAALPALTFKIADPNLRNPFIQDRTLTIQYEFLPNWSLELTYQGRKIDRYQRVIPANVPLPASSTAEAVQLRRPNPEYGLIQILKSDASYSSNGMQARVTRRLTNMFSMSADFRWDKALTNGWNWMSADINNPRDFAAERSVHGFRPLKSFSVNYIIDLPVGKDRLLSSQWAGKLAQFIEGWRISGITSIEGGRPFSVQIFGDPNNDGLYNDRPNRIGPGTLPDSERTINKWFETADYVMPDYGESDGQQWFGNAGRNTLMAPGSTQWDISLLKTTRIASTGHLLEFRVQFFNAFNHVNLGNPGSYIGFLYLNAEGEKVFYPSSNFGAITSADNAREIEFALKYSF